MKSLVDSLKLAGSVTISTVGGISIYVFLTNYFNQEHFEKIPYNNLLEVYT